MLHWIEIIRRKPEGVRRTVVTVLFVFFSGIILTTWLWNLSGSFPYRSIAEEGMKAKSVIDDGNKKFQEFRANLGELKQTLLDALAGDQQY